VSFEVVVDHDTLEVAGAGGSVVGRIHVLLDDTPFPDLGWWDFPCVVLGWWLQSVRDASSDRFNLRFMDGPVAIAGVVGANAVTLTGFHTRGPSLGSGPTTWAPLGEVVREIDRAATSLVGACEMRGLPTDGLDRLLRDC
jgi:hypothetical protein